MSSERERTQARLREAAERQPDKAGPQIALARHYMETGRLAPAERLLLKTDRRLSGDVEVKLALVGLMMRKDDPEAAARWLEMARDLGAAAERILRWEVQLAGRRGDLALQRAKLEEAVALIGDREPGLRLQLCACLIALGEPGEARRVLDSLKAIAFPADRPELAERVRLLELEIAWAEGRHGEVFEAFEAWTNAEPPPSANIHLNFMAKMAERHGPDAAAGVLRRARRAGVGSTDIAARAARYRLGEPWIVDGLVDAVERGRPVFWKDVIHLAADLGEDAIGPVLTALERSSSKGHREAAGNVRGLLAALPPASALKVPLVEDDTSRDVLRARTGEKPEALCLVFAGMEDSFSVPAAYLDRFLASHGLAAIYLRDRRRAFFELGVESLGDSYEDTIEALRAEIAGIAPKRLYTFGVSAGGFAAVRHGLDLGAEAVLGLGLQSWVSREGAKAAGDPRSPSLVESIWRRVPAERLDLAVHVARAQNPPRIDLHYGEAMALDRFQAHRMKALPGVRVFEKPGLESHAITMHLIKDGQFDAVLEAWLTGEDSACAGPGGIRRVPE